MSVRPVAPTRSRRLACVSCLLGAVLFGSSALSASATPSDVPEPVGTQEPSAVTPEEAAAERMPADAQAMTEIAEENPEALDAVPTHKLVVTVSDGQTDTELDAIASELGASSVDDLGHGSVAVEVADPLSVVEATEVLADLGPAIAAVEPDLPVLPTAAVNDTYLGSLWGMGTAKSFGVDPSSAWAVTTGGGVIVAVVDTGVDIYHPDLSNNIWVNSDEVAGNGIDDDRNGYTDDRYGFDFYSNDASVFDSATNDAHGTHVAGTIAGAANNGFGVVGVAPHAKIMPLKFISGYGYTSDAVRAINYAVANGADVINASWGGGGYSSTLKSAIDYAGSRGVVFVAAAGNNGTNIDSNPYYPAALTSASLITVAAMTATGTRASFSNFGLSSVDIAAPGESILSTVPGGGFAYYSGTSMAAPHVSGIVALVKSFRPSYSASQVKNMVLAGSLPNGSFAGLVATGGMANAPRSLQWLPPYWWGWDIVRGVAMSPTGVGGYTFDGWGGIHAWHDAPAAATSNAPYWVGWDIVRSGTVVSGNGGFTLDGWGGIHAWGGASANRTGAPYWRGWDIARGMAVNTEGSGGWTLDGWGGIHAWGGAPSAGRTPYWPGWDIARGMAVNTEGSGGWTLDGWGGIHAWGGAPVPVDGPYWKGWDIARGLDISADGKTLYIIDGWGGLHPAHLP